MRHLFIVVLAALMLAPPVRAEKQEHYNLTIYSSAQPGALDPNLYRPVPGAASWQYHAIPGYGIVRHTRPVALDTARTQLRYSDVAALIDPTTVMFTSLTDPEGTTVLEQNYHFDLVSLQKLAERYIGKTIRFDKYQQADEPPLQISGALLSVGGDELVVQQEDGSVATTAASQVTFPRLPDELYTRPTLVWDIATTKPGRHQVETSYETGGMTWWADYNILFREGKDANSGVLDLNAWVTLVNKSGASYPDATLKLIAGDVQKAGRGRADMARGAPVMMEAMDGAGFSEKAFFEYHLYTLGRPTALPENSVKQLELFPAAAAIPAEKQLVYDNRTGMVFYPAGSAVNQDRHYGAQGSRKVSVYLKFANSAQNGLGIPLPKGRIRVNTRDDDGAVEFIGEDVIDHTPKDEDVMLRLGNAFDVIGERTQTDFQVDRNRRWMSESFVIVLRNHKDKNVKVLVKEDLHRGQSWKITNASHSYSKEDASQIEFAIDVPADGEQTIRYTVEYTW